MGGEALDLARLDERGVVGDRWYAVEDEAGRFASGKETRRFRRRDAVFEFAANTEIDGRVIVSHGDERWYVGDPELDQRLSVKMGTTVRVAAEVEVPHQDMGAVSIVGSATLQWCADRWGGSADPRRLRVNVVVDSDQPFVEERWAEVQLGKATVRVVARVPRCRMLDIRQDGVDPGENWLKPLAQERDMCLGVYADVVLPGDVVVGDDARCF